MTLEKEGCERLAATAHGSLIHPFENTACVEVGGDVSIDATFTNSKYIMNEYGNTVKSCHFVYRDGCQVNGADCPTNMIVLNEQHIHIVLLKKEKQQASYPKAYITPSRLR